MTILWFCTLTLKGIGVLGEFFECQISVAIVVHAKEGGRGSKLFFCR